MPATILPMFRFGMSTRYADRVIISHEAILSPNRNPSIVKLHHYPPRLGDYERGAALHLGKEEGAAHAIGTAPQGLGPTQSHELKAFAARHGLRSVGQRENNRLSQNGSVQF